MAAKALVVDDSRAMRSILAKILMQLGFEVVQAGDGREAIGVLSSQPEPFQLVLSDWNMPEMDGLQLLKALRANPKFSEVPVVMVTSETRVEQMMTALRAGANEYIMKPFTAEMIEDKLRLLQVVK
jgi:two-component system chemotaxis response regulator CheY